jgi:hypothetical protein
MTSLLNQYQWILVPRGFVTGTSQERRLSVGLRVTPQLTAAGPSTPALSTLADFVSSSPGDREALEAWPSYLAHGDLIAQVRFRARQQNGAPGAPNPYEIKVDLSALWRAQLDQMGLGVPDTARAARTERSTQLWKAIFPLTTPVRAKDPTKKPAGDRKKIRRGWYHRDLAAQMATDLGAIYTDGFARQAAAAAGADGQSPRGGEPAAMLDTISSAQLPASVANLARIYETRRFGTTASFTLDAPHTDTGPQPPSVEKSGQALADWFQRRWGISLAGMSGAESESSSAPFGKYLSPGAREELRRQAQWIVAGTEPEFAKSGVRTLENGTRAFPDTWLYQATLNKHLLLASDPKQYLPPKTAETEAGLKRDFHGIIGSLSFHPLLLRAVGLTINFELSLPPGMGSDLFDVRIEAISCTGEKEPVSGPQPWVAVDAREGLPLSRPPGDAASLGMQNGCVSVAQDFQLVQLDADGTLEKLTNAATSARSKSDAGVDSSQLSVSLAPQRTAGISLLHVESARYQSSRLAATGKLSVVGADTPAMFAEDLTIGFRPDIRVLELRRGVARCPAAWQSLVSRRLVCARIGSTDISDWFSKGTLDEGLITYTLRVPKDASGSAPSDDRIAQEELFQLEPDGWNLIVPRPSLSGDEKPTSRPGGAGFQSGTFDCRYTALPNPAPLRIGRGLRMGLRAVFCDGQGVATRAAAFVYENSASYTLGSTASAYLPLQRGETIGPPDIHLLERLDPQRFPGERGTRLVVTGPTAAAWRKDVTTRYIVPPRRGLELAILHGMYDSDRMRAQPPRSAFERAALRADGSVPTVAQLSDSHLTEGDPTSSPDLHESILTYPWISNPPDQPYLPDPWAERLIIGIYRAADEQLLYVDYYDYYDAEHVWPNCRPLKFTLRRSDAASLAPRGFSVNLEGDHLEVRLAPAQELRVRFWHELDHRKLSMSLIVDQMAAFLVNNPQAAQAIGLPADCIVNGTIDRNQLLTCLGNWEKVHHKTVRNAMPPGRRGAVLNLVSFWMLNPSKSVTLVHAVNAPIRVPELSVSELNVEELLNVRAAPSVISAIEEPFLVQREVGGTVAVFSGDVGFDRASTQRLDCIATWTDPLDDASSPSPSNARASAALWSIDQIKPALPNPHVLAPAGVSPDLQLTGWPTADIPLPELAIDNDLLLLRGKRERVGRVANDDLGDSHRMYDFHDSKARKLLVTLKASNRFNGDFPKEALQNSVVSSRTYPVWVDSSKPPDAPAVDYVIPLLKWQSQKTNGGSLREAGWNRIWLSRGWYSSGEGEQLALVCWPQTTFKPQERESLFSWKAPGPLTSLPPKEIEPFVTRWGSDPLWNDRIALGCVPASAFCNQLGGDAPTLDVRPAVLLGMDKKSIKWAGKDEDYTVALALFNPTFDEKRRQWYVDINMDPADAYFPFMRLALARYNPHSLQGVELSRIVVTEIIQLMPKRAASVTVARADAGRFDLKVALSGAFLRDDKIDGNCVRANKTACYARIEERDPGWWGPTAGQATNGTTAATVEERSGAGDWIPISDPQLLSTRTAGSPTHDTLTTSIRLKPGGSRQYSVFIEEWEPTVDWTGGDSLSETAGCACGGGRLVYADRLLLRFD